MKHLLLTTIAAVLVVGCGESQQSAPAPEAKPEPTTVEAPDIDIHEAARIGNIEAVKQHLAAGTDVNAKGSYDLTTLHGAASWGRKEVAELLIAAGADVNAKSKFGTTPLDKAIGYPKLAGLLRKHGGKHSTINMAAQAGDIEAVKEFLAAGSDVNAKGSYDLTTLHGAASWGRKEVAELLIAKGADVNAKSKFGTTSLHDAAKGHKEIVELLIAKGVNVNAKNNNEWTPLHFAANGGHKEIVEILITEGAEVNAKEEDGRTPLDWAKGERRRGPLRHPETADLLRKHGGKTGEELKTEGK